MNFTKLSDYRYRVENQNGLKNAVYDFFEADELGTPSKKELRSYLRGWPKKYPCIVTIIDNTYGINQITFDVQYIPDTSVIDALITTYDKYIALIGEELNAVVPIAASHGWKSHRYEAGKALREEIEALKKELITAPPQFSSPSSRPSSSVH